MKQRKEDDAEEQKFVEAFELKTKESESQNSMVTEDFEMPIEENKVKPLSNAFQSPRFGEVKPQIHEIVNPFQIEMQHLSNEQPLEL